MCWISLDKRQLSPQYAGHVCTRAGGARSGRGGSCGSGTVSAHELAERIEEIDDAGGGADPARLYLRRIGAHALLDRRAEIEIAKRIEDARDRIATALLGLPGR